MTDTKIKGICPACGRETLFLGGEGYVTCSWLTCPNPAAASDVLEQRYDSSMIGRLERVDKLAGCNPRSVPAMEAAWPRDARVEFREVLVTARARAVGSPDVVAFLEGAYCALTAS